ncbi:hypothetical protein CesoFtcFv8_025930 [Champsocephalus esox]|uniref:Uncharacterized protein n=2 Tax=Champsocephalus TaxID=52236 RepID=A0AAN8GYN2_CHAGU|nr:hypothetical protein CesoFtcFv8_025930 [Champsocephalus esox]KAK5895793.1 hypothetical protein CgunFtcFv8_009453 [Champsocephalus gunnari]
MSPRKITLSRGKQGNIGHRNASGNSVHTHNVFLYYESRLRQRINDNCSPSELKHQADNPRRLLRGEPAAAATPRIR